MMLQWISALVSAIRNKKMKEKEKHLLQHRPDDFVSNKKRKKNTRRQ